jgi:hypothetical protein
MKMAALAGKEWIGTLIDCGSGNKKGTVKRLLKKEKLYRAFDLQAWKILPEKATRGRPANRWIVLIGADSRDFRVVGNRVPAGFARDGQNRRPSELLC